MGEMKRSLSEPKPLMLAGSPPSLSGILLPSLNTPPRRHPERALSFQSTSNSSSCSSSLTPRSNVPSPSLLKVLPSPRQMVTPCAVSAAPSGEGLLKAIEDEDTRTVKAILEIHPRLVNYKNRDTGHTPLMTAIRSGHPHIADYLLTIQYIDTNVKDNENWTALLFAADMGWAQLVRKLIEDFFVDVNNSTSDGMTALIIASSNGHLSVVNFLLDVKDLDVNRFDSLGYTALMYATENGFLEVVRILIEKGCALVSLHGAKAKYSPFEIAVKNGYGDLIKYFSDFSYSHEEKTASANLEDVEEAEIVKFVRSGNLACIRRLVDDLMIDVNVVLPDEWTMLGLSIELGQTNITKFLLSKFHDHRNPVDLEARNEGGRTILMLAASKGDFHLVSELLTMITEKNVNAVDYDGLTALMHGIQYFNVVKILIEKGLANVNVRHHVQTPLCWAVMKGTVDIVRYLVDHAKADVNTSNQYKQTPLMLSILAANDPSITSYLLSRSDVDVNAQDLYGVTAFMHAVSPRAKWKFDAFELFEDSDVDISIKDSTGNTAISAMIEGASYLTLASLLRRLIQKWNPDFTNVDHIGNSYLHKMCSLPQVDSSAMDIMLGCCVSVDKPNNEGKTPLMYAAISDNIEAAQWLIEVGNADPNRVCKAGYSVLMYTTRNYQSQVGAYLMDEVKVDTSIKGPDGKTALEQRLEFESWYQQQAMLQEAHSGV